VGFRPLFLLGESSASWQLAALTIMDQGSVAERVNELAEQTAIDHGVELVHAEVAGPEGHPIVRVFIDKPGGVTHDDCSDVSHHLGTVLDVEDFIHSAYTLEVSSPGLERGLYKPADYERFAGHLAKIKTRSPIKGQRNFRGRITGLAGSEVIFEDRTSGRVRIALSEIAKANLEFDAEAELRQGREREATDRHLIKQNIR
jgi:ribosome maturation factor RimP